MITTIKSPLFIVFLLLGIGISSCQQDPCASKENFLQYLDKTIEDVKETSEDWEEEEWKAKDGEVEKLMDECYEKFKDDFTREEREQIFHDATTYVFVRQKEKWGDLVTKVKDLDLQEKAEKFLNIADDEVKDIFNEVLKDEDVQDMIDDVLDEFNNLAKELKDAWEEHKDQ